MNWLTEYENLQLPTLSKGAHDEGSGDLCIMEAIAFIERLPHSDTPPCTSIVVAKFLQGINDIFPEMRQSLWQYADQIVGTNQPELDQKRAEYLAMRAVNIFAARACRGKIADALVDAMERATTLEGAKRAADAAADAAAAYAADAAHAAANAAADAAANAAADAAAYAAYAADAAYAAHAAYAAYAAANAADVHETIRGLLAIGPVSRPALSMDRVKELVAS